MYLSYLSGPQGIRIPSSEFFTPFPPDLKFGYRRDTHRTPEHFLRAYHLRDKETGEEGPWRAGLTLEPSVVYESWCSQRPGGIIVMIQEIALVGIGFDHRNEVDLLHRLNFRIHSASAEPMQYKCLLERTKS